MKTKKALMVLRKLADEVLDDTNREYGSRSIHFDEYSLEDLFVALHLARRALKQSQIRTKKLQPTLLSALKPLSSEEGEEETLLLEISQTQYKNASKPWSDEEECILHEAFNNGRSISSIALDHGRTIKAICTRLNSLGYRVPQARYY